MILAILLGTQYAVVIITTQTGSAYAHLVSQSQRKTSTLLHSIANHEITK